MWRCEKFGDARSLEMREVWRCEQFRNASNLEMREIRVITYRRITQDKSPVMDNRSSVERMESFASFHPATRVKALFLILGYHQSSNHKNLPTLLIIGEQNSILFKKMFPNLCMKGV